MHESRAIWFVGVVLFGFAVLVLAGAAMAAPGVPGGDRTVDEAPFEAVTAPAAPGLVDDMARLIEFAGHHLDVDGRTAALTPHARLTALRHSLTLYGVRVPSTLNLKPDMASTAMAKTVVDSLTAEERQNVAAFLGAFVQSLRDIAALPKAPPEGHAVALPAPAF